jgi:glycine hydroxymethyltransferase
MVGSGLRIGTPAVTTRGLREAEMTEIGNLIARVLDARGDAAVTEEVKSEVRAMCERFPVY